MRVVLSDGWVDLSSGELSRDGAAAKLSDKERAVLEFLVTQAGEPVTLDTLHTEVWGFPADKVTRAAYHTIGRLRRKIEPDPDRPTLIRSAYADGYLWSAPAPASRLIGRESSLEEVRGLVAKNRLVVLTGPGGIGKTALSREIAPSPVFCDLCEALDEGDVLHVVAMAFGIRDSVVRSEAMADVLDSRRGDLVVLDNAEQVVEAVSDVLQRWLPLPGPGFVVTSRVALSDGLPAADYAVPPLEPGAGLELLVERGRVVRPGVLLATEQDSAAQLIDRLGGLPLAIELAAARLGVAATSDVLAAIGSGDETWLHDAERVERHRSLKAVLDWSWQLLSPEQRQALTQCAVFRRSWPMDRAEAVIRVDGAVPALLESLVSASLLTRSADGRLDMLVPIRVHVRRRLAEDRDVADLERRHGEAMADAETGDVEDIDDLFAAARAAVARGEGTLAARLALALFPGMPTGTVRLDAMLALHTAILGTDALDAEHRTWISVEQVLARWGMGRFEGALDELRELLGQPLAPHVEARVHYVVAAVSMGSQHEDEAWPHVERARELWTQLGEPADLERLALLEAHTLMRLGRHDEVVERLQALPGVTTRNRTWIRNLLGISLVRTGQEDEALAALTEALTLGQQLQDDQYLGQTHIALGAIAQQRGDDDGALEHMFEARRLFRRVGLRTLQSTVTGNIARAAYARGDYETARREALAALVSAADSGIVAAHADALIFFGGMESRFGRPAAAEASYREALTLVGDDVPDERAAALRGLALLRFDAEEVGPAQELADEALSVAASVSQRVACLVVAARICVARGDLKRARHLRRQLRGHETLAANVWAEHYHALEAELG